MRGVSIVHTTIIMHVVIASASALGELSAVKSGVLQ